MPVTGRTLTPPRAGTPHLWVVDLDPRKQRVGWTWSGSLEFNRNHRVTVRWDTGSTTEVLAAQLRPWRCGGSVWRSGYAVVATLADALACLAGGGHEDLPVQRWRRAISEERER